MGKRSSFERKPRDFYPTPYEAVVPLLRFLPVVGTNFIEPCAGDGRLIRHLGKHGFQCVYACDIEPQAEGIEKKDVLFFGETLPPCDLIVTNPVWEREVLHKMIDVFRNHAPTWLLFDAGWAYTKQAKPFLKYCHKIVPVGRVKWMEDTDMSGKDDCSWYFFLKHENDGYIKFVA